MIAPPFLLPLMFLVSRKGRSFSQSSLAAAASAEAVTNLPPLLSTDGRPTTNLPERLAGKRVALYFAAGWCPMCTRFEQPSLSQFREVLSDETPIELLYVPSDRSAEEALRRASAMNMVSVPFGKEADAVKLKYKIWSGSEALKLGFGRRSGVPALVVLDGKEGKEMAFIAAEAEGVRALSSWPLDDASGIW